MKPSCSTCEREAAMSSACTAERRVSAPSKPAAARTSALSLAAGGEDAELAAFGLAHAAVDQLVVGGVDRHARHFQQGEAAVEAGDEGDAGRALVQVKLLDVIADFQPALLGGLDDFRAEADGTAGLGGHVERVESRTGVGQILGTAKSNG